MSEPNGTPLDGERTIDDLGAGDACHVVSIQRGTGMRRRLMELGFIPGTPLRLVRRAPLGDPIEVELHGAHVSMRRAEARTVIVRGA